MAAVPRLPVLSPGAGDGSPFLRSDHGGDELGGGRWISGAQASCVKRKVRDGSAFRVLAAEFDDLFPSDLAAGSYGGLRLRFERGGARVKVVEHLSVWGFGVGSSMAPPKEGRKALHLDKRKLSSLGHRESLSLGGIHEANHSQCHWIVRLGRMCGCSKCWAVSEFGMHVVTFHTSRQGFKTVVPRLSSIPIGRMRHLGVDAVGHALNSKLLVPTAWSYKIFSVRLSCRLRSSFVTLFLVVEFNGLRDGSSRIVG
ncbi:hypothetical protein DY000_02060934 [Brassica cretica]|uniref:DUF3778 domain-containing protein n=1 Tax=Brassica cretica TaxID=69181 RepID=A0ABQ7B2B6_BRACR|nr:hypothetical protein DY000_02060934 [Brassica cretica]